MFVGDCCEKSGDIYDAANGLNLPAFMFLEGDDPDATKIFKEVVTRTKGAFGKFDTNSAKELAELLRAVAAFVAGGVTALADQHSAAAVKLLGQLRPQRSEP